ncbi:hypothetical protein [Scleromatobacter humisilvae]|uniref:SPOR domain-containing protein n=1 Tax=Scleromatobacter humisilvae TaxID=2897159 RepID=A0A9X1YQR3_9BURK|nr:hypothetical protein [Scleromatobacter humisilvae]MCK9689578.1 hypothetical protein [Scleromatobacter humisilvae]
MLRALVLLFALVNAGLYFWLHSDPQALQPDREPQRLGHQVSPDAVQVLPDVAASAVHGAASAASTISRADSGAAVAATLTLSTRSGETALDCAETPALDDAQFAALKAALAKAGVPAEAIAERRQPQDGAWIVYLGRFADAQTWQQKADELRKLDVKFERVNTPGTLAPGLSLGQFKSQAEAGKKLDALTGQGVRGARIVVLTAPTMQRHLQVRAADPAWHHATGAQRFDSCPLDAPSST